jgi:hypothetical protein
VPVAPLTPRARARNDGVRPGEWTARGKEDGGTRLPARGSPARPRFLNATLLVATHARQSPWK